MKIEPYLNFDGNCAEAFRFYEKVFKVPVDSIRTHGDSPIADEVPPEWHDRVLHARMVVGQTDLMASDSPPGHYEEPKGIWVSVNVEDPAEADRIFHALAENGRVVLPIDKTFWARRFGMLVDQWKIPWMINCA
jgi:PhnB protein